MRTRDRIFILLFTVTLALGALILLFSSDNDDSLRRFRLLLFNNPVQLFTDAIVSSGDSASLWYGGIALIAVIMIGLVLKMASGAELRVFRERLVQMEVAKAELETSLQDSLWREKHAREARDAAVQDLESSVNRTFSVERQLSEAEDVLRTQERELKTLRTRVNALTERQSEMVAAMAQGREKGSLGNELWKRADLLQANDSALKQLEKNLTGKIHALENQINVKEKLLRERDKEMEALRVQLSEKEAAKHRAENLLAEELRKEQAALQAKDSAIKELEKNLSGKAQALESQLSEKRELLQSRTKELDSLKAEVNGLTGRLAEMGSAKERAEQLLQEEVRKITKILRTKDSALKEAQESSRAKIVALEGQLADQEKLITDRDTEIGKLRSKVNALAETTLARDRAESLLAEELKLALQAKDSAMKDVERKLNRKIHGLEIELKEKQDYLQSRSKELEGLNAEIDTLTGRLAEMALAKEHVEHELRQELNEKAVLLESKHASVQELETNLTASVRALENQIAEKAAALTERDRELKALRSQLAKMGSAEKEIETLLRNELKKTTEVLQAKDSTIKELEESLNKTVLAAENQSNEQEARLKTRDGEIEGLKSEVQALRAQLTQMLPVPVRIEGLAEETVADKENSNSKELEESFQRLRGLESLLKEKGDLLEGRDEKIQRLESELKQKRTELARREIAVWQAIERRDLWKQRLRKIGITLKD